MHKGHIRLLLGGRLSLHAGKKSYHLKTVTVCVFVCVCVRERERERGERERERERDIDPPFNRKQYRRMM